MPEIATIPIITAVTTVGTDIEILILYNGASEEQRLLTIEIKDSIGTQGGVSFLENELVAFSEDYPVPFNIYINSNGELIIIDDYAAQYSINANGELLFTEP